MFRLAPCLFPRCALLVGLSPLCSSRLRRRKWNVNIELVFFCLCFSANQERFQAASCNKSKSRVVFYSVYASWSDCIFKEALLIFKEGFILTLSNVKMRRSVPRMKIYRQQLYAIQFVRPPSYAAGERPAGSAHNFILSTAELADKSEVMPNKCGRSWQSLCGGRTLR